MTSRLLHRHWAALVFALAVGALLVLPPFWAKFRYGIPFSDPVNIRIADEFYYLARVRDVLDGYPLSGNAFTWERKAGLSGQPVFLGEYLTAEAIRLTGLDVVAGSVALDAVLPIIAVLLTYAAFAATTSSRGFALLGTAVLFFWFFPGDFARTVSPQMNFLFWLSLLLMLHALFAREPRPHGRAVLIGAAALNFGLLFYLYTYYWTFWLAFLGIMLAIAVFRRDRPTAAAILKIVLGGFAVALPYLIAMARLISRPEYGEAVRRIGMIDSHFPSGIAIIVPATLLLAFAAFLIRYRALALSRGLVFFSAGALGAIASVNQHIITGKNLEFSSHYYMLSVFWFVLFGAYLVGHLAARYGWGKRVGFAAAAIALGLAGYAGIRSIPPQFSAERGELRRYLPLFQWLNAHAAADESVVAPLRISELIPIYTSQNVFFSSWLRLSLLPDEEALDRYAIVMQGEPLVPEAAVRAVFGVQYLDAALHTAQENRVRRLFGLAEKSVDPLPREAVERIATRLAAVGREGVGQALGRYRADYLVLDQRSPSFQIRPGAWAEMVYGEGDFMVYRLRR